MRGRLTKYYTRVPACGEIVTADPCTIPNIKLAVLCPHCRWAHDAGRLHVRHFLPVVYLCDKCRTPMEDGEWGLLEWEPADGSRSMLPTSMVTSNSGMWEEMGRIKGGF